MRLVDAASDGSAFFDGSNNGPLIDFGRCGDTAAGSRTQPNDCAVFLPTKFFTGLRQAVRSLRYVNKIMLGVS